MASTHRESFPITKTQEGTANRGCTSDLWQCATRFSTAVLGDAVQCRPPQLRSGAPCRAIGPRNPDSRIFADTVEDEPDAGTPSLDSTTRAEVGLGSNAGTRDILVALRGEGLGRWRLAPVPSHRQVVNPVRPGREQRQRRTRVPGCGWCGPPPFHTLHATVETASAASCSHRNRSEIRAIACIFTAGRIQGRQACAIPSSASPETR